MVERVTLKELLKQQKIIVCDGEELETEVVENIHKYGVNYSFEPIEIILNYEPSKRMFIPSKRINSMRNTNDFIISRNINDSTFMKIHLNGEYYLRLTQRFAELDKIIIDDINKVVYLHY